MQKHLILASSVLFIAGLAVAQNPVRTFNDTRVINTQSVEVIPARKLDVRISHRFGDIAGENGGFKTFWGLEQATDVVIGAEYGLYNNLNIGLFRSKGAGFATDGTAGLRQLMNGTVKWQVLHQDPDKNMPVTLTLLGVASMSAAKKLEGTVDAISNFDKFAHRLAYTGQLLIAHKYGDNFSLQLIPGVTFRNIVGATDDNLIFSAGVATRLRITRTIALVADATIPFSESRKSGSGYHPAIGIGAEFDTGGHVFQINLTNATGIMETGYIPYTTASWGDGEFRLGFTVSRLFNL